MCAAVECSGATQLQRHVLSTGNPMGEATLKRSGLTSRKCSTTPPIYRSMRHFVERNNSHGAIGLSQNHTTKNQSEKLKELEWCVGFVSHP